MISMDAPWVRLRAPIFWLLSGALLVFFALGGALAFATEEADRLSRDAQAANKAGDRARAVELWRQAIERREAQGGDAGAALAGELWAISNALQALGRHKEALPYAQRELALVERAKGEHADVAISLNNLASLYHDVGQYAQALPLYQRSLDISEKFLGPEHPDVATSLNNLAEQYRAMGQYAQALPLYQRSLGILEKVLGPEHPRVAASLNNLAGLYVAMGQYAQALPLHQRSLGISEKVLGPEHPDVATSLNNLAELYVAMGQYAQALPLAQRAFRISTLAGDPDLNGVVTYTLAAVHAALNQPDLAIFFGKQSVNSFQSMRQGFTGLDQGLQRGFLDTKSSYYQRLAGWLIDEGRLPEAQQVLGMLKEEELFEFVRRDGAEDTRKARASYTGQEQTYAARFEEVRNRLGSISAELDALEKKAKLGLSAAEQTRRKQFEAERDLGQHAFDRFLAELIKTLGTTERGRAVAERNLPDVVALQDTLASLGHGAVLLHYVVLEERTHLILTTAQIQLQRESGIKATELNQKIARLREALQHPELDPRPLGRELYDLLIAPVAEDLRQAKAQTLMLALDGTLRYIPFAVLYDGTQYLAERYALSMYTEAAKDRLRDKPGTSFAGLGLTRAVSVNDAGGRRDFSALPAVKEELDGILKGGILPGEVHFDEAFNAAQLRTTLDQRAPVLHIASHFVFRPGTEADSYLLLGDGTPMTLAELRRLRFRDVDLITLSACETAVGGGKDANGREIEGFGALAQRQGAKGVLASLWPVADQSTGMFMQSLYRIRQSSSGTTKAQALRQAQLQFIRGAHAKPTSPGTARAIAVSASSPTSTKDLPAFSPNPAAPYAHPYYWAPFILMGNWL